MTGRRLERYRPRRLILAWLAAAVGLGLLLMVARVAQGPLDDPDQAWQRPGFLDAGDLPAPAADLAPGLPANGSPTVVFFERPSGLAKLCRALARTPRPGGGEVAVVVASGPRRPCPAARVVVDPDSALTGEYGLRRPRGGGPPVGYAVVDAAGAIRYRTLDPGVAGRLGEVATIVDALP